MLPWAGMILLFGTMIAVITNLIAGIPVVLLADRLFRRMTALQILVPTMLGAALGGYVWDGMLAPASQFEFWKNSPGLVIGGSAALAMTLAARRISHDWNEMDA